LNAEGVAYHFRFLHLCVKIALTGRPVPCCLCYPKQAIFEPRLRIASKKVISLEAMASKAMGFGVPAATSLSLYRL
jgi:hypothetical protein